MRRAEVPEQRVDAPWGCRCGATNCKGARQCEAAGGALLGAVSEPSRNLPAGEQRRRVADLLWTSLCTDGPQNGLGADSEVPVPSRPLETLLSSPPPPAAADSADAGGTAARAACVSVTVASISRAAVDCAALYELPGEMRPRCARDVQELSLIHI